jgi:hypothetical protein
MTSSQGLGKHGGSSFGTRVEGLTHWLSFDAFFDYLSSYVRHSRSNLLIAFIHSKYFSRIRQALSTV